MTTTTLSDHQTRIAGRIAGLSALSVFLDDNVLADVGFINAEGNWVHHTYDRDEFARIARTLKDGAALGDVVKEHGEYTCVTRTFQGGVYARVQALRADVCEQVVVGTEKVLVPIWPDGDGGYCLAPPDPVGEQTVEREVVEWRCRPILDGVA